MNQESDDKPLQNESMLQFLKRKKRFYELLLCAWDQVEFDIDQLVADQYGLHGADIGNRKVKFLLDWPFGRKLDFLRDIGVISKRDFRAIQIFQQRRNTFSHSGGWSTTFLMTQNEREQLMDEAVKVAQLTFDMLFRARTS